MSTSSSLVLEGVLSSTKRAGRWIAPSHIVLRRRLGSVQLDFSDADLPDGGSIDIVLDVIGGSVEIRVPHASRVEDSVSTRLASVRDHRRETSNNGPRFTLSGTATWCSVEIRGPKREWLRGNRLTRTLFWRART